MGYPVSEYMSKSKQKQNQQREYKKMFLYINSQERPIHACWQSHKQSWVAITKKKKDLPRKCPLLGNGSKGKLCISHDSDVMNRDKNRNVNLQMET